MAAPQTPPSSSLGSSPAAAVPKRLLTKSKRALSEADLSQASAEKPVSPSKSQGGVGQSSDPEQSTPSPPPKSSIGTFHHLPHYMKLYEIIKGAYANNQVTLKRTCCLLSLSFVVNKGLLKRFQLLPDFSWDKFVKWMLSPFEQICYLVKSVESLSNGGQMEVESSLNLIKLLPIFI